MPVPEREPLDEDAAWAEIVAGYDEETTEPERDRPARRVEDVHLPDGPATEPAGRLGSGLGDTTTDPATDTADAAADQVERDGEGPGEARPTGPDAKPHGLGPGTPINSITVFAAGTGPRDWEAAEPGEAEDHFVPPEPPPLPETDVTTKFAWAGALGGPLLLIGAVLFQQPVTWWMWTLGIGGFLGGFFTLVARMREDDEDGFDDPGRGAVV